MYEKISTVGMSREEWLRLRKTGIGGSDAGAVCGLNKTFYRSHRIKGAAFQLYVPQQRTSIYDRRC